MTPRHKQPELSQEQAEQLALHMDQNAEWKQLLKVLNHFTDRYTQEMVEYNLDRGGRELVIKKARIEGARRLIRDLIAYRERLIKEVFNGGR